jgi:hypothetical protein
MTWVPNELFFPKCLLTRVPTDLCACLAASPFAIIISSLALTDCLLSVTDCGAYADGSLGEEEKKPQQ